MASSFIYLDPKDTEEVCALLHDSKNDAYVVAGGTDLLIKIRNGAIRPRLLIGLRHLSNLKQITSLPGGGVKIGALVTMSEVAVHPLLASGYSALVEAVATVGSVQIQNVATLIGNICNASPAADTAAPLLLFNAIIHTVKFSGRRTLPLEEFFLAPGQTALGEDEIVESVELPPPVPCSGSCYLKLGRTRGPDLALAGAACLVTRDGERRLALTSVAPTPLRIREAESILSTASLSESIIIQAERVVVETIAPVSDIRASKEYREAMILVLIRRALQISAKRAN